MRRRIESQRGTVLMVAMILVLLLSGLAVAYVTITGSQAVSTNVSYKSDRALYLAEAGLADSVFAIQNNRSGNIASSLGGGSYAVSTVLLGTDKFLITSKGFLADTERAVEVVLEREVKSLFQYGFFSDQAFAAYSNSSLDGYDSALGSYESQVSGRSRSVTYAGKIGMMGSNGAITLNANVQVFGEAHPGPGASIVYGSGSSVSGSTSPLTSTFGFPAVTLPAVAKLAPETLPLAKNGSRTLAPGEYNFSSISVPTGASLTIDGPATLVIGNFTTDSNSTVTINATGGPVVIYGTGTFAMNSNTTVSSTTQVPSDLQFILTTNIAAQIRSNASLYASIYAPNAQVTLNSNSGFWGAATAKKIQQESNFATHYDVALGRMQYGEPEYQKLSWREVKPTP
jgi:hypothetical protein